MNLFGGKLFSRPVLGLEIASRSVRAVWVRKQEGRAEIVDSAVELRGSGEEDLLPALGRIARRTRQAYPETVACFSGGEFREGASLLPPMPEKELADYLRMNVVPADAEDPAGLAIKYSASPVRPAGNKRSVITQTVPSAVLKTLLDRLGRFDLLPSRLIFPGAAYRALLPSAPSRVLLAAIGRERTTVYLYREGELAFVRREERLGLDSLIEAMTAEIAVPGGTARLKPERAEEFRRSFGVPGPERLGEKVDGLAVAEIWPLLRSWCDRLASALRDGALFYRRQFDPGRVEAVFLTGEGASTPGLAGYLEKILGLETSLLPLPEICRRSQPLNEEEKQGELSELSAALGAALSSPRETNLLSPRDRLTRRLLLPLRVLWFVLPAAALFFLAMGRLAVREREQIETRTASLSAAAADLRSIRDESRRRQAEIRRLEERENFYRRILEYPDLWIGVLGEVSRLIPDSLVLNRMELVRREGTSRLLLSGHIRPGESHPKQTLTSFLRELGTSPFFREPRNLSAGDDDTGLYRFSFLIDLRRGEGS